MKKITALMFAIFVQALIGNFLIASDTSSDTDDDHPLHDSFAYSHSGAVEDSLWEGIHRKAFEQLNQSYRNHLHALAHKKNITSLESFEDGFQEGFKLGYASQELSSVDIISRLKKDQILKSVEREQFLKLEHQAKLQRAHEQLRSYTQATGLGRQKIKDKAFRQGVQEGILQERRDTTQFLLEAVIVGASLATLGCTIS